MLRSLDIPPPFHRLPDRNAQALLEANVWGWPYWVSFIVGHFLVVSAARWSFGYQEDLWFQAIPQIYFLLAAAVFLLRPSNRQYVYLVGTRVGVGRLVLWTVLILGILFVGITAFEKGLQTVLYAGEVKAVGIRELLFVFEHHPVRWLLPLILAPICEELFFRGALQPSLYRDFLNPFLVIVYAAFIFMLCHFSLYFGAFLLALVNGYLYFRFHSLLPGMLFHAFANFIAISSPYFLPATSRLMRSIPYFDQFFL